MSLKRLQLESYRNHRTLDLSFSSEIGITFFIGNNAQGKTNILESIYLLALTRSFRDAKNSDLIMWNADYARVKGVVWTEATAGATTDETTIDAKTTAAATATTASATTDATTTAGGPEAPSEGPTLRESHLQRVPPSEGEQVELEVFLGNPPNPLRSLKVNQIKVTAEQFIGNLNVVLFHPEDLNMLYLGPDLRRKYLDIINIQTSKSYFRALKKYKRLLEQRNSLLKLIREQRALPGQLVVWDEQLAVCAGTVIKGRATTVAYINSQLKAEYQRIANTADVASVGYKHALEETSALTDLVSAPESVLSTLFLSELRRVQATDIHAGVTTLGPHRDDLLFALNGRNLSVHASRGEYRSLLLALKLIEVEFYTARVGNKPLLLLDDVFSELDEQRKGFLVEAISNYQSIISTTHIEDINLKSNQLIDAVYTVDKGSVIKK